MMVEPTKFFFNTETATDNEFMHKVAESEDEIMERAIKESQALQQAVRKT